MRCDGCKVWVHAECDKISSNLFKVYPLLDILILSLVGICIKWLFFFFFADWCILFFVESWRHWLLLPYLQSQVWFWVIWFRKTTAKSQVSLLLSFYLSPPALALWHNLMISFKVLTKPIYCDSSSYTNLEYFYVVRGMLTKHFFLLGKSLC